MAEKVRFGDTEFTVVREDDEHIRLVAEQTIGNQRFVIVTKGSPDQAEALKNALEEADSNAP